jgi:hypothetical protein
VGRTEGLDIASRTLLLCGLAAMAEVPLAAPTKARSAVVVDFAPAEERSQLDSHQQAAHEAEAIAPGALVPSLQLLWTAVPPPPQTRRLPRRKETRFRHRHCRSGRRTPKTTCSDATPLRPPRPSWKSLTRWRPWVVDDALNPLLSLLGALRRSTAAHAVLLWSLVCRADVSGSGVSCVEVDDGRAPRGRWSRQCRRPGRRRCTGRHGRDRSLVGREYADPRDVRTTCSTCGIPTSASHLKRQHFSLQDVRAWRMRKLNTYNTASSQVLKQDFGFHNPKFCLSTGEMYLRARCETELYPAQILRRSSHL